MAPPFMLVSNFKVKDGNVEDLRDYARSVTELIQEREPRVIAFHSFLSEDEGELSTIHLHPDVASMELHMQLQRDNWEETFSRIATMLEGVRVDFYGAKPPESALENFRRAGSEIGIKPIHLAGFTRARTT
jgi:ribosomal protein S12 methylthiotransferase accessory factor YcaO